MALVSVPKIVGWDSSIDARRSIAGCFGPVLTEEVPDSDPDESLGVVSSLDVEVAIPGFRQGFRKSDRAYQAVVLFYWEFFHLPALCWFCILSYSVQNLDLSSIPQEHQQALWEPVK